MAVVASSAASNALHQAEACRAILAGEGWQDLDINVVLIHDTIEDWSAGR